MEPDAGRIADQPHRPAWAAVQEDAESGVGDRRWPELYVVEVEVQLTVCRASQRVGEDRVCYVVSVRWNQYGATLTSVTRNGS